MKNYRFQLFFVRLLSVSIRIKLSYLSFSISSYLFFSLPMKNTRSFLDFEMFFDFPFFFPFLSLSGFQFLLLLEGDERIHASDYKGDQENSFFTLFFVFVKSHDGMMTNTSFLNVHSRISWRLSCKTSLRRELSYFNLKFCR